MVGKGRPEDSDVWAHVARTVTPLKRRKPLKGAADRPAADKKAVPAKKQPAKKPKGRIPRDPPAKPAPKKLVPELAPGAAPGLDKRNAMRLRRGQLEIEARIDLHGMTRDEAEQRLRRFLLTGYAQGKRCVLVITGKGTRGGGVIRGALAGWLNGAGLRPIVVAFSEARAKDGGGGAFYVYLRRERKT